jgi:preprotein translocase subunit Sec63
LHCGAKKCPTFNWRELAFLRFSVLFLGAPQQNNRILFTTAPMEMNHYEVLEISRDAELIDIKKAYRRLALK